MFPAPCPQAAWPTPSVSLPASAPTSPAGQDWAKILCDPDGSGFGSGRLNEEHIR